MLELILGKGDAATRIRIGKFFWPVAAFGIGAMAAALGYLYFGFWALLVPITILLVLLLIEHDAAAVSA